MKYALLNNDNMVVNIIVWPYGQFIPPHDHQSIQTEIARLGDHYENGQFVAPDGTVRQ